jgi:hypothetical protein
MALVSASLISLSFFMHHLQRYERLVTQHPTGVAKIFISTGTTTLVASAQTAMASSKQRSPAFDPLRAFSPPTM